MFFQQKRLDNADRIIGGLRSRDPKAVADLYEFTGCRLYSAILAIVRNRDTAEDLVQDTFVRVWNHSQQFSGDAATLTQWVLSIGRHRAIDYLRASRRDAGHGAMPLEIMHSPELMLRTHWRPDSGEADGVRKAMAHLPAQQKRVIELAYFQGLSQIEVATLLGEHLGTVKEWTRMALKRLRGVMAVSHAGLPAVKNESRVA